MALSATSANRLRAAALACALALGASEASATPELVADVDTGQTLFERDATAPWFPASLTKLMTAYVALQAVRDGRLTLDTPLTMSARAANTPASKMGFRPGVEVTLDNALKMLMVKSPNDVAVMVAESISGSVEAFADEMNATARRLGLKESHFVNPNGLHDPTHVSSARDMAMIGRALLRDFPEHSDLYGIGALRLGDEIILNHNGLLGRYPGADGMKTGFTCPAGFNVVASATQGARRLIVVVLGFPSARDRTIEAAHLFDRGFAQWGGGEGQLESLPASSALSAPDMRPDICSRRNRAAIAAAEEEEAAPPPGGLFGRNTIFAAIAGSKAPMTAEMAEQPVHFDPVPIFIGPKPGWTGPVLAARPVEKAPASGTPSVASAYAADKPSAVEGAPPESAPIALQSAVRPMKPAKAAATAKTAVHAKLAAAKKKDRHTLAATAKTAVHAKLAAAKKKDRHTLAAPAR
jgi:D-alanyl-D-alanine carboxypeptidase